MDRTRNHPLENYIAPNLPSKCTWSKNADPLTSPHKHMQRQEATPILSNILQAVGNTPLVKLNKIPQSLGIKCDVYVKCEFFNPGGSIKDRIAMRMIEDAERSGRLTPGCTIIEATSGNTGIGLALAAAVKGYRCIIVMPEKISKQKVDILGVLGAEVRLTSASIPFDAPDGVMGLPYKLQQQIPNSVVMGQFSNASNPLTHYDTTAEEILAQFGDDGIDMLVAGSGTGGTIAGVGRKMKEKCPKCIVVGADPVGSPLALPESLNTVTAPYTEVEGLNYYFVPTTIDRTVVDEWVKCSDVEGYAMARRLICEEGLLCGGSSGNNMAGAMKAAAKLKAGQKCIVILPDDMKNYLSTLGADQWMEAKHLKEYVNKFEHPWWDIKVSETGLHITKPLVLLNTTTTCREALKSMKENGVNQLPIIDDNKTLVGMATLSTITRRLMNKLATPEDAVEKVCLMQFFKVHTEDCLGLVSRIMEIDEFALVVQSDHHGGEKVVGMITQSDFIQFIAEYDSK